MGFKIQQAVVLTSFLYNCQKKFNIAKRDWLLNKNASALALPPLQ